MNTSWRPGLLHRRFIWWLEIVGTSHRTGPGLLRRMIQWLDLVWISYTVGPGLLFGPTFPAHRKLSLIDSPRFPSLIPNVMDTTATLWWSPRCDILNDDRTLDNDIINKIKYVDVLTTVGGRSRTCNGIFHLVFWGRWNFLSFSLLTLFGCVALLASLLNSAYCFLCIRKRLLRKFQ